MRLESLIKINALDIHKKIEANFSLNKVIESRDETQMMMMQDRAGEEFDSLDSDVEQGATPEKSGSKMGNNSMLMKSVSSVASMMIANNSQNNLCRLCLLKTNRFDNLFKTPGYKLKPNGKRLMTRMDRFQCKILQTEFDRCSNWSQEKVEALAARLSIPKAKVYKWNWDQRNKQRDALFAQSILGDEMQPQPEIPDGAFMAPEDLPSI